MILEQLIDYMPKDLDEYGNVEQLTVDDLLQKAKEIVKANQGFSNWLYWNHAPSRFPLSIQIIYAHSHIPLVPSYLIQR